MPDVDTDQIRARLDAAKSEGAWRWEVTPNRHWADVFAGPARVARCPDDDIADFIAHAPSDIAALLAEVERLARWKAEATPLFEGLQDLGRALQVPLGAVVTGPEAIVAADRLRARAEAAESALERVRVLPQEWRSATCVTDGAPCSFHRHAEGYAADLVAALDGAHPTPSDGSGTDG